ncbi:hypothetical protein CANTEDRAFT_95989 [Yamadazyma tenuis ATCC 10573]|nr:uncharacterized protein CANTEDRAFT_95989 [Yamadazyma tenuis ATCC 10573]EGV61184.1 hypothetical protein CANTEDRAFT_95989 [Yamadazyma tenuis ATCC 10573]
MDPAVSQLKFSSDGEWMCTLDIVNNNEIENLLSQDDKNYALKFWKPASASGWELVTKIIDPHLKVQVLSVMPYQNGFITADASANLRFWKLRNKSWAVVKTLDLMKPESKSVDLAISEDNSVIVVSHDNVVYMVNSNFKLVQPLSLVESHIRSIELVGTDLIILSKTKLVSFNLVTFEFNSLMAQVAVAQGKTYLCTNNQLVALALNIQDSERCKVMLFKPNDLHPVFATIHSTYVNSIIPYNDGFLFVDNELRSGIISTNQLRLKSDESEINGTSITAAAANSSVPADEIENFSFKTFDLNSFNNIFETDNLDTLFDKIIKIVK